MASRHWYSPSLDSSFTKQKVLTIYELELQRTQYTTLDSITRPYETIKMFCNVEIQSQCLSDLDFWKRMGNSLKFLEIHDISDNDWQNILEILSHLENLESLYLNFNYNGKFRPSKPTSLFKSVELKKLTFIFLLMNDEHKYLPKLLELMPEIIDFRLSIPHRNNLDVTQHPLFNYLNAGKNRIKILKLKAWPELIFFIFTIREMNLEYLSIEISDPKEKLYTTVHSFGYFTNRNKLRRIQLPKTVTQTISVIKAIFPKVNRICFF